VKRTSLDQFQNIRTTGIQAILLEEGDELVHVALVGDEQTEIVLATYAGQLVRFALSEVRPMGRATYGVFGVRLSEAKEDRVVMMAPVVAQYPELLTLTSNGFGKRTPVLEYRRTRRGAYGVRTIQTGGRNGSVVAVLPSREDQEVLVTTQRGMTIRVPVSGIRSQGRDTMGVRVIRLDEGDEVKDAIVLETNADTSTSAAAGTAAGPVAAPPTGAEGGATADEARDDAPEANPDGPDDDAEEGDAPQPPSDDEA
jgi:DNA gyrase subunit A